MRRKRDVINAEKAAKQKGETEYRLDEKIEKAKRKSYRITFMSKSNKKASIEVNGRHSEALKRWFKRLYGVEIINMSKSK